MKIVHTEFTCGHIVFSTDKFFQDRVADRKPMWCTICGMENVFLDDTPKREVKKEGKVVYLFGDGK